MPTQHTITENLTQEKVYLPSHPDQEGAQVIYFYPQAIDEMTLEEYGLYTCIYYSNISHKLTTSDLRELSSDSPEETDKIIFSLLEKGWIVEEVANG